MRRSAFVIATLSTLLLSCGAHALRGADGYPRFRGAPAFEGDLRVRPNATDQPSLELRFPVPNQHASLGWGAVHLWARPDVDHVGVTALLDAPARTTRWRQCDAVYLRIDNRVERVDARYVGRPMEAVDRVYDAVQLQLNILQLRKMALAQTLTAVACGDPFEITELQRDSLLRFVEWFDALASPHGVGDEPWYREVGPEPVMPFEEEATGEPMHG